MSENDPEKTLLLVDGSSYLYRAFHALPELRNPKGEPTGAIYGVLSMLRRLAADYKAQARACVFDAKGRTFRDDAYPQYKAHRPPMPEDLASQIEPLKEAVAALGWQVLAVEGVEADDVIATLAEQAKRAGWSCVVSTGDKDLAQLVDGRVTLVNTMSNETLDAPGVMQKFGVPADKFVDYLTLVGDSVDNVPGVEQVGPKTAAKWISQYGSLDAVIAHAGEVPGAAGENLRKALDWLPKGRSLLTVKRDVALPLRLEDLVDGRGDPERQKALFERFGFKSWLREVESGAEPAAATQPSAQETQRRKYVAILDAKELNELVADFDRAALVGFDTETTGLDPMTARLVGMSFACGASAAYLPLAHDYPGAPPQLPADAALAILKPWLESDQRRKVGQNLKFDAHVLANHGVRLAGIAHDTLLESYVLEAHERHDLDSLAQRHLGWKTISYDEVTGKGAARIAFSAVEVARATDYAAEDADCALALHDALHPRIAADAKLDFVYRQIELPVLPVLLRMERNGVLLDAAKLDAQSRELGKEMLELEQRAYQLAGQPFNLNSPKQIQEILFERQKLPVKKKTPLGQPSTDEDVLEELAQDYPLPKVLLEYRALAKLKSTYTDKLPRMVNAQTGRVHTTYSQTTAVTGRLASNDPNLQNIPIRTPAGRRIREAFIAPPGSKIVSADYSQIELRIMAHLSGDAGLRHAFLHGHDVHRATAAEVFGRKLEEVSEDERRTAKVINFGLIYGMSSFGLAQNLGIERVTAQAYIDSYFSRYPGVKRYMDQTREKARAAGFVETVFGRRLYLPEMKSGSPARRQAAERAAINAPMQGTAADLIKLAMVAVQGWLDGENKKTMLIMQVHDELVLEVPETELAEVKEKVRELMQTVAKLEVALVVDVGEGDNWDQAH
ncbi:MAG: DNA polymerase I [Betaproteobacteria bacterium RIFCSPHIGHO2_12_FULL_69_13]|nr:MAG: DNA polymerase I [Betaproteobacteria bacterium RIFCSPHIGHO2_12_FULL_69_13]OGA67130.1 MAG: DNA polymerase I [Betaproteobacteria bacterium RIFCSPLOWO2_12_FULL_68_20]